MDQAMDAMGAAKLDGEGPADAMGAAQLGGGEPGRQYVTAKIKA